MEPQNDKRPSVLIVEDESDMANLLENRFTREGYDVDVAYDGASGLEAALKNSYDVMLLDIELPVFSGMELLKRLQEQMGHAPMPVVIFTNLTKFDFEDKKEEMGVVAHVIKSQVTLKDLARKVDDVISEK